MGRVQLLQYTCSCHLPVEGNMKLDLGIRSQSNIFFIQGDTYDQVLLGVVVGVLEAFPQCMVTLAKVSHCHAPHPNSRIIRQVIGTLQPKHSV